MRCVSQRKKTVVIIGGGPGGYESALVAAQLGADVTIVDSEGLGGAAVLTDCVPSKTLIATSDFLSRFAAAGRLGVGFEGRDEDQGAEAHLTEINHRILDLARAQSRDIQAQVESVGVRVLRGTGRMAGPMTVEATLDDGRTEKLSADVVLVAVGTKPRVMDSAKPDGERILTWQQIYDPFHNMFISNALTAADVDQTVEAADAAFAALAQAQDGLPPNTRIKVPAA